MSNPQYCLLYQDDQPRLDQVDGIEDEAGPSNDHNYAEVGEPNILPGVDSDFKVKAPAKF